MMAQVGASVMNVSTATTSAARGKTMDVLVSQATHRDADVTGRSSGSAGTSRTYPWLARCASARRVGRLVPRYEAAAARTRPSGANVALGGGCARRLPGAQ